MRSRLTPRLLLALGALACTLPRAASAQPAAAPAPPDIPFETFRLDNGLTVVVHEDRKAPVVAVNVWYHVGSKNEPAGRSGFAHLFEHLMFNGSENFDGEYISALEAVGATDLNGTTNTDRTNYFQNVPTSALDRVLFLESDRMGHLVNAIDAAQLDEQRGVVQNEKRQGENQPYGRAFTFITEAIYPAGHPYAHTVIGSMDDLNAASLDNVKDWFKTYYGPGNAVVVLAGDIDVATAREKMTRYFGDIPPGPPIAKFDAFVARRTGTIRQTMEDRVPQSAVYMVWNVPQAFTRENVHLGLASSILGGGKTSRLYKRLVYDDQLATNVSVGLNTGEIGSSLIVNALVRPGQTTSAVERAIEEELARFLREGPTADELARVQTQIQAGFLRGIERIGGFGGKSDVLARSVTFAGRPDAWKQDWTYQMAATPAEIRATAAAWLADGVYVLTVTPFQEGRAATAGVDRSRLPAVAAPPAARFPAAERATLSNGLKVVLAPRTALPLVSMSLVVDAGTAADPAGRPGTARLAMDMLDEGTATRPALALADALARLGANLGTSASSDYATVSLSALKANLAPSLDLMADVVMNPAFPEADLERLRRQQLAGIQREKTTPQALAFRVLPALVYGEGHPYAAPPSGTEASLAALTRADLAAYHGAWFKPNNGTLVVVGDVTMAELKPLLEARFAGWRRGDVPRKPEGRVATRTGPAVYLLDRPGAPQSIVLAAQLAPASTDPGDLAFVLVNDVLGGSFSSRLNLNLREEKHWSYGARATVFPGRGPRLYTAVAPVQADKTAESLAEVAREMREVATTRPATAAELTQAQNNLTLGLAGRFETNDAVRGALVELMTQGRPEDYWNTYADRVRALTPAALAASARATLTPDRMVYVVVGDRASIEAPIRALNLGPVTVLDADGKPIPSTVGAN